MRSLAAAAAIVGLLAPTAVADGCGFGPEQVITTGALAARAVFAADMDGDGDNDVLSASTDDHAVGWYENTDGFGTFGPRQVIAAGVVTVFAPFSVFAADLDGDGDNDVLSASQDDDKIAWYENTDGLGAFGPQQVITTAADGASFVFAADVDGDGDRDVLSTSKFDDKVAWYENTDGLGAFGAEQVLNAFDSDPTSIQADLDGDGDLDAAVAWDASGEIGWHQNTDGTGLFGERQVIASGTSTLWFPQAAFAADLDGDGDQDVLSASANDNKIAWYENDGSGAFGPQQVITLFAQFASDVHAADLDGDGDVDVLSASPQDGKIAWYENLDGAGIFGPQQVIVSLNQPRAVIATDVDGDGDQDVVATNLSAGGTTWYENDGLAHFGPKQTIGSGGTVRPHAADVDGDGDQDVLGASSSASTFTYWFPNDGLGTFAPKINVVMEGSHSVVAGDFDSDGDQDVLVGQGFDDEVAWFENVDGAGNFGPQTFIGDMLTVFSVFASDVDADGDLDALAAASGPNRVSWYRCGPCPTPLASSEVTRLGTPPNPAVFLPGVTSGPVSCQTWDPVIDHSSFMPFAIADVVGMSVTSLNVPSSIGTFLCAPPSPGLTFAAAPGQPIKIPIPGSCTLIGFPVCTQALSRDVFGNLALTNALDITIGTF